MRVDLIVPRFPPAHWNFAFAMDLEGSAYSHPPLGVATLAAHTPDHVSVRILDENVAPIDLDGLAPIVGISAMYIQRARTFELADAIRATGRTVVLGGGLVNALPDECARRADVVFHGEAEETWPAFLDDVAHDRAKRRYDAPSRFDLAKARVPRFDLLPPNAYSTGSIQTSRGCPFACDYCDVPNLDGTPSRTKSVEQVMREVRVWWELGKRSIFFVDDHFLGNRAFAVELLRELERFVESTGRRLIFYAQATLNVAKDEQMLELLHRAGFRRLFIGIESDDHDALRRANKKHNTLLPVAEAVRRIQRWNITVWAALLVGFDDDRGDVVDRYLRLVREAGLGMVIPGILQAVPGTPYAERMRAEERLVPLRNRYVGGQAGSLDSLLVTNVKPRHMSHDALIDAYRRFARELYEPEGYADRVIAFLSEGEKPELDRIRPRDLWEVRAILGRTLRHYLLRADPRTRRAFLRVVRHLARTGMRRADEGVFHLVIYKHLQEFYRRAADAEVPLADDLAREAA